MSIGDGQAFLAEQVDDDDTVWVCVISHYGLDATDIVITVHADRPLAEKEVECTAHAIGAEWPEGMLDVPDEATLGDPDEVEGWMTYRIQGMSLNRTMRSLP